jgi:hypothetical protein
LTYLLQELFLVIPKALTPGLHPTLYHNNHSWTGSNPHQDLLQGTGALAIFVSGILFASILARRRSRSKTVSLFLFWMAYQGIFESLPQVILGAIIPSNDVGMAMNYLCFGSAGKLAAALIAIGAMAGAGFWLTPHLLAIAESPEQIDSPRKRSRFVFRVGTVPAFAAILLIVPFRVPRNPIEVFLPPVIAAVAGMIWLQGSAWRATDVPWTGEHNATSILLPLCFVLVLLLIFQLLLRPGIRFG